MSITKIAEEYEKSILNYLDYDYKKLRWCELGNQGHYSGRTAKQVYKARGILQHTSMDLNGKDGALKIDLGQPIAADFKRKFNVITNYGTIEHINNQYQVFKNIHDMCKLNGIIIHAFPMMGNWPGHCRYYYSGFFVKEFAKVLNYLIIDLAFLNRFYYEKPRNLIMVTYKKRIDNEFIEKKIFNEINGIEDTRNMRHTGNYTK